MIAAGKINVVPDWSINGLIDDGGYNDSALLIANKLATQLQPFTVEVRAMLLFCSSLYVQEWIGDGAAEPHHLRVKQAIDMARAQLVPSDVWAAIVNAGDCLPPRTVMKPVSGGNSLLLWLGLGALGMFALGGHKATRKRRRTRRTRWMRRRRRR